MKDKIVNAVIMAGGKGTRISSLMSDIPKPMIKIDGKPLLERQIEWLISQRATEVTLIVGHLKEKIVEYFGSGERFGISIRYITETEPLGTAGGLFYLLSDDSNPILLVNGDILLDINLKRMLEYHSIKKADITVLTHPNSHPYDSALIETDEDGRIVKWINKEDVRGDYQNRVNAGVHLIERRALEFMEKMSAPEKLDLDRNLLKPNIGNYKIYAYDTPEYVKDMGTPERYRTVCKDFNNGLVKGRNLKNLQKAIFLDRDGTINKLNGFIKTPEEIELIDGSAKAIQLINQSGYLAIVITNQPVVARGDCTIEELQQIHNRLARLLGEEHAYLDDIFYCPHHPDKGFEGERLEYKVICECRKPNTGLFQEASIKYNIDLNLSYMVGDSESDILAGIKAGCKTAFIGDKKSIIKETPDLIGGSLIEVVERILHDNN